MPLTDNPAGRLQFFLTAYRTRASNNDNPSVMSVWKDVLGVTADELPVALCEIAALVPLIEHEVEKSGREELHDAVRQYKRAWTLPILSFDNHPNQSPGPGPDYVDPAALVTLGVVSALLSATSSDSVMPATEEIEALKIQLNSALQEVTNSQDLPSQLRTVIVARLHDMLWAIDHISVAGPDGILGAVERVAGSIVLMRFDEKNAKSGPITHVVSVLRFAWTMFKQGSEVNSALEGWSNVMAALPPVPPTP